MATNNNAAPAASANNNAPANPPAAAQVIPVFVAQQQPSMTELRAQIFGKPSHPLPSLSHLLTSSHPANAMTLFPQLVVGAHSYRTTGVFNPGEIFQVIISSNINTFTASLIYGGVGGRRVIMRGAPSWAVQGAVYELLRVSGEAIAWYEDNLVGELEHGQTTSMPGGEVNHQMIEDGFHFADVQRRARGI